MSYISQFFHDGLTALPASAHSSKLPLCVAFWQHFCLCQLWPVPLSSSSACSTAHSCFASLSSRHFNVWPLCTLVLCDFQRNLKAEVALAESAGCQSMRVTSYSIRAQLVTLKLPYLSRRPPLRLARRCGAPRLPPGLGVTSLLARPAGSGAAAAGLRVRACQWFNLKFESDTRP